MAGQAVIVTGLKQLDDVLAQLEVKVQKKFIRKALRNVAKKVVETAKRIVHAEAYDTGTLHDSFKVRALKRSRRGIGVAMFVDRDKLFALYESRHGRRPTPRSGEDEPHYYLASIEFGYSRPDGTQVPAVRPMRRALYENEDVLKQFFKDDLTELIRELAKP